MPKARFYKCLTNIQTKWGKKVIPIHLAKKQT